MPGTDRVVASAESVRQFYIRQVHADPAKVEVIYNAVDWAQLQTTKTREEMRRSLNVPCNQPVAGIIARLTEQKGHPYLFDALAHTPGLEALHVLVVGDGDLRDSLSRRVEELGLSSRVHFAGARRDLGDLLNADGSVRAAVALGRAAAVARAGDGRGAPGRRDAGCRFARSGRTRADRSARSPR